MPEAAQTRRDRGETFFSGDFRGYLQFEPMLTDPQVVQTFVGSATEPLSPYGYAHGNPFLYSDPNGESAIVIGAGAAAIAAAAGALAFCMANPTCRENLKPDCNRRCRLHIDPPHHDFGILGKRCHLQLDCYKKGVRRSGQTVFRIPVPCNLREGGDFLPPTSGDQDGK